MTMTPFLSLSQEPTPTVTKGHVQVFTSTGVFVTSVKSFEKTTLSSLTNSMKKTSSLQTTTNALSKPLTNI